MANQNAKLRVVLDTNVWLSALVFGGKPRKVVELLVRDLIDIVISQEMLTEMRRKIVGKFPDFIEDLEHMELLIERDVELVKLGSLTINICRDPDDNRIIETAAIGVCEYIVSGDKDLLSLGSYKEIRIVTPSDFVTLMDGQYGK